MTWFSDKLGKKFLFKPIGVKRPVDMAAIVGKPVKAIGFHGEPDRNMTYYTVEDATGRLWKAYDPELTEEVDRPISKDELAIANAEMIKRLKAYMADMIDSLEASSSNDYIRGYRRGLENTMDFLNRLEAIRDGIISEEQAARNVEDMAEEGLENGYSYR